MKNDNSNMSCSSDSSSDSYKANISFVENDHITIENDCERLDNLKELNSKPLSIFEKKDNRVENISEKDSDDDINDSIYQSLSEECEQRLSIEDKLNNSTDSILEEKNNSLNESENVLLTNDDKHSPPPIKNIKNKKKVDEISRETQRLIAGDGHVRLPYHKPKQKSLSDFLDRRKHLLAEASVTGSRKKLQQAWEMIERKELNAHKFYNNDDVADNENNIEHQNLDTETTEDTLTTTKSHPDNKFVNKKLSNKLIESKSFKLGGGNSVVHLSQSVKFKSLTSCDGDDGLLIIDDSETVVKKQKFKKNLSSHSQARSNVLKHELLKRVRAARESNLQECPSSDEDDDEYLSNDKKKQDFEENAFIDEDEELYGDDEQEEESGSESDINEEEDEREHEKKMRKSEFMDLECEVEDDINESESDESNCDIDDQSNNLDLEKNISDSDSSVGIITGVLNLLSSDSETVDENYKNTKKKRPAVLSDSDSDDKNSMTRVDLKVSNLPFVDSDVASTQQLLEMCSGSEFCTQESQQENDDGSSDGFDSDVPLDKEAEQEDSNLIEEDSDIDENIVEEKTEAITDFFDAEAELSEDEEGGWNHEDDEDDEDEVNEEDLKMIADDNDEDEELVRDSLGKIYMRQMLDDDQRQVAELQEMLLEDGNLHNDLGRKRKFQWEDTGDDLSSYKKPLFSSSEGEDDDDNDDDQNGGNDNEAAWRKERHIRDSYLAAEDQDEEKLEDITYEKKTSVNVKSTEKANEITTAVVKGSFMMKKGSRNRAAAALMLVDSKKKVLGKNNCDDDNSLKSLTTITAKASVTNPFSYLLGNASTSNSVVSSVVESKLSTTKTVNKVPVSKVNNETQKKKCSSILKAFFPLE